MSLSGGPTHEFDVGHSDAPGLDHLLQVALMPSLIYTTPEAECFHSVSDWSFNFPNPNRLVGKHDVVPHRLVMCVDAGKVSKALKQLEVLVAAGAGNNNE